MQNVQILISLYMAENQEDTNKKDDRREEQHNNQLPIQDIS